MNDILIGVAEAYDEIYDSLDSLPSSVRSEYRSLLISCLRDGESARIRGRVEENEILDALRPGPTERARLVSAVFTYASSNYRFAYTQTLFARLSVDIAKGINVGAPLDLLEKAGFANYESFLKDLIERRNQLAHSFRVQDLLSSDLLSTYIELVGSYLYSLARVVQLDLVTRLVNSRMVPLGTVVKRWRKCVGVVVDRGRLEVGDRILLLKEGWCTAHQVVSLRSEEVDGHFFEADDEPINLGIGVAHSPINAEGATAYLIPKKWRDYWPSDRHASPGSAEVESGAEDGT